MSKYTDSEEFPEISIGKMTSTDRQKSYSNTDTAMGTVIEVLAGNEEDYRGIGDILADIMTDQHKLETTTVHPLSPHHFTIPLPNEKIHCVKDGVTGEWYYTGIVPNRGMLNHLPISTNRVFSKAGGEDDPILYGGEYFKSFAYEIRSLDLYEGDVVIQGRFGQSLRFTGSNSALNTPWSNSPDDVSSPITILRNGYLPVEHFESDYSGIWLTSDQHIQIPLPVDLPPELQQSRDTFDNGQVIIFGDRIVLGSKTSDIILASKETIALCTPNWQHDVDTVLDTLTDLIGQVSSLATEVKNMAQTNMIQTFPVTVLGLPGMSTVSNNIAEYATGFSNTSSIVTQIQQLKTNIDALKQK